MAYKRILTIQDISCVGQCSLTVALPVLSACGVETAILPSSVLSTHTTGFYGYTFRDLSEDMPAIKDHWVKENISFSAVYTGYMGNAKQIDCVLDIFDSTLEEGGLKIVDPAMADHGRLYPGFDREFVQAMKGLCAQADWLLPNLTEACLLTGTEYREEYDRVYIDEILAKLTAIGCKNIVFTGVSYTPETTGVVVYENGNYSYYEHEKLPKGSHGTGDIYASAFTGSLMAGKTAFEAAKIAADYAVECIKETLADPDHWYGPKFEPVLYKLIEMLK